MPRPIWWQRGVIAARRDTSAAAALEGIRHRTQVPRRPVTVPAGTRAGSCYAVVWAGPQAQTAKPGSTTLAINTGIREYLTVS